MIQVKAVAIIGANGAMGASSAGIIASFGNCRVYMVARNSDKAKAGINCAVDSVRSDSIRHRLIPKTFEQMTDFVPHCDWVLEALPEDLRVKQEMYARIDPLLKSGTIVSTVTSGLSIARLAESLSVRKRTRFFGTHFFNPPYRMLLCELTPHRSTDHVLLAAFRQYLEEILYRKVVVSTDTPAFVGNRIGFQMLNEAAQFAEEHAKDGGVALADRLLSGVTGRVMPPLVTIDFVGLDVHKAIVSNLYGHLEGRLRDSFLLPAFMDHLINLGKLGFKAGEGLYKRVKYPDGRKETLVYDIVAKDYQPKPVIQAPVLSRVAKIVAVSDYERAFSVLKNSKSFEARVCHRFIAGYISHALSLVGTVVKQKEDVDIAMGYGYNWVPPSALVDLLGGLRATRKFIERCDLPVPLALSGNETGRYYTLSGTLDARRFIVAN